MCVMFLLVRDTLLCNVTYVPFICRQHGSMYVSLMKTEKDGYDKKKDLSD